MRKLGAFFVLSVLGCVSEMGRYPLVTTRPVDLGREVLAQGVEATDCRYVFDPTKVNASAERAIDSAIRSVQGADALVNVRVDRTVYPYAALLWNRECIRVQGDAVRLSSPAAAQK